jgi:hypothetical protein
MGAFGGGLGSGGVYRGRGGGFKAEGGDGGAGGGGGDGGAGAAGGGGGGLCGTHVLPSPLTVPSKISVELHPTSVV